MNRRALGQALGHGAADALTGGGDDRDLARSRRAGFRQVMVMVSFRRKGISERFDDLALLAKPFDAQLDHLAHGEIAAAASCRRRRQGCQCRSGRPAQAGRTRSYRRRWCASKIMFRVEPVCIRVPPTSSPSTGSAGPGTSSAVTR